MPRLEQTTRVLKLYALDPDVGVTYVAADDDTELITTAVSVTHDDYDALGEPDTVTVTIRPGDQLNPQE